MEHRHLSFVPVKLVCKWGVGQLVTYDECMTYCKIIGMCVELTVFLVNDSWCRSQSHAGHLVKETKDKRLAVHCTAIVGKYTNNIEMHAQSLQVSITFIS